MYGLFLTYESGVTKVMKKIKNSRSIFTPSRKATAIILDYTFFQKIHYTQTVFYRRSAGKFKDAQDINWHRIIYGFLIMIFVKTASNWP